MALGSWLLISAMRELSEGWVDSHSGGLLPPDSAILRQLLIALAMISIMLLRPRGLWPAPEHGMLLRKGQGMGPCMEQGQKGEGISPDAGKKRQNIDGLLRRNVWASYTHIFAPAIPCWATNFVAAARRFAMSAESQRSV